MCGGEGEQREREGKITSFTLRQIDVYKETKRHSDYLSFDCTKQQSSSKKNRTMANRQYFGKENLSSSVLWKKFCLRFLFSIFDHVDADHGGNIY